jgi:hypothetical protein
MQDSPRSASSPNWPTGNKREIIPISEAQSTQRKRKAATEQANPAAAARAPYLHRSLAKSQAGQTQLRERGEGDREGKWSSASAFDVISARLRIEVRPASHYDESDARRVLDRSLPSSPPPPASPNSQGFPVDRVLGFLVCLFTFVVSFNHREPPIASAAFNSRTSL